MIAVGSWSDELPLVVDVDVADGVAGRRRRARGEALVEVGEKAGAGSAALALRTYAAGCVVLALGGVFDRAALARLREMMGELDRLATVELVIELSLLADCEPGLARALAGLRVRRLVAGTRVQLHSPPPELSIELGHTPPQAFTVIDTPAG